MFDIFSWMSTNLCCWMVQGTKIQASILQIDIELFEETLHPSRSYYVSNAYVRPIKTDYWVVENSFEWIINDTTMVEESQYHNILEFPNVFGFVCFADFHRYIDSTADIGNY